MYYNTYSMGRWLVTNDLYDIIVSINGVKVQCNKAILCCGNKTLKKLIEDMQEEEKKLDLFEECSESGFLEVEKYYGGGVMNIDEDTVCEILKFGVYYDDAELLKHCNKYIKEHLTEKILAGIFNITKLKEYRKSDLYEISESRIMSDVSKFIKNDDSLYSLSFASLCILLDTPNLIIKSETWLFERLLNWYENYKNKKASNEEVQCAQEKIEDGERKDGESKDIESEDIESEDKKCSASNFVKLIYNNVKMEDVRWEEINKYADILNELKIRDYFISRNRLYVNNEEIDKRLLKMIQKYCDENIYSIEENDLNEISKLNGDDMKSLLLEKDIRIIKTVIIMLMDSKINIDIDKNIKCQLIFKLCKNYNECESMKIVKCLCYFTNEKDLIYNINDLCEDKEIIYKMLNFYPLLCEECKDLVIKFVRDKYDDVNDELIHKYISNDKAIDEIKYKVTVFSYASASFCFIMNEDIYIKPECDSSKCVFSINPYLPKGINLNPKTGEISGKVLNEMDNTEFTITCSNNWGKMDFDIFLQFKDVIFIKNTYAEKDLEKIRYAEISKDGKTMIQKSDEVYSRRWLDLEMKDGIYHISFQFNCRGEKNILTFGISNSGVCYGDVLYTNSNKCLYCNVECGGKNVEGTLCRIVEKKPLFDNHGDGSNYELIIDIKNKQFLVKHNNSKPILIAEDFCAPIYALVSLYYVNTSVTLKSITHEIDLPK